MHIKCTYKIQIIEQKALKVLGDEMKLLSKTVYFKWLAKIIYKVSDFFTENIYLKNTEHPKIINIKIFCSADNFQIRSEILYRISVN